MRRFFFLLLMNNGSKGGLMKTTITKKDVEELRKALREPDTDYDLPEHVPVKKGQVVATFIKRHKKKKD